MAKTIQELEIDLHSQYLNILGLYRFIKTNPFQEAFIASNDEEKIIAIEIIEKFDKIKLVNWTKRQLRILNLIEILDVRYLRTLGQELGVKNYATLPRFRLIAEINQCQVRPKV